MNILGWLFMIVSWTIILVLCILCFKRIFQIERESMVAPIDIEADIEEEEDRGEQLHPAPGNKRRE